MLIVDSLWSNRSTSGGSRMERRRDRYQMLACCGYCGYAPGDLSCFFGLNLKHLCKPIEIQVNTYSLTSSLTQKCRFMSSSLLHMYTHCQLRSRHLTTHTMPVEPTLLPPPTARPKLKLERNHFAWRPVA